MAIVITAGDDTTAEMGSYRVIDAPLSIAGYTVAPAGGLPLGVAAELRHPLISVSAACVGHTFGPTESIDNAALHIALYGDKSQLPDEALFGPTRERLAQIARLPADWDAYGSEPPSGIAVRRAYRLFDSVVNSFRGLVGERIRPFSVAPLPSGGVQAEWRSGNRAVELEVGPDGTLGYLTIEGAGPEADYEEGDEITSAEALALLSRVLLP